MVWYVLKLLNDLTNVVMLYSGDAVEASAIKSIFSDHATSGALALSSTKVKLGSHKLLVNIMLAWFWKVDRETHY